MGQQFPAGELGFAGMKEKGPGANATGPFFGLAATTTLQGLPMRIFFFTFRTAACAMLLLSPAALRPDSGDIAKVFVDNAGAVHLVDRSGHDRAAPKLKDQISAADAKVAPDGRTAGWLVEYENCCTSYPVPLTLVLFRNGRVRHRIRPGLMIYDWGFEAGGSQAALCEGTVHGQSEPHCLLYDSVTGKLLNAWQGQGTVPGWAAPLRRE
jgi:hypothetical protein